MTHSYTVAGITCNGCVAKVKSNLLKHPDITAAEVTLEDQKAVITMQKHLSISDLQKAIGGDSKYTISEDKSDSSHQAMNAETFTSRLTTYKPLLTIAAFITCVAVLTSGGNLHLGMNNFMAGFFLVFSFFKLLDVKGFATSYAMYDLAAKRLSAWGYVYPFVELALGVSYLTGISTIVVNWVTVVVMGFSSLGVIQSVVRHQKIQCACLGAVFNLPMSTVTIIEDLMMVAMAAAMLAWPA